MMLIVVWYLNYKNYLMADDISVTCIPFRTYITDVAVHDAVTNCPRFRRPIDKGRIDFRCTRKYSVPCGPHDGIIYCIFRVETADKEVRAGDGEKKK